MWYCRKKAGSYVRYVIACRVPQTASRTGVGLSVNAEKKTIVLFTNNKEIGRLFCTELRMTDQVKYLGMILDKKLDWKAHFENRMRRACIAY
jgi:hypothetical protein